MILNPSYSVPGWYLKFLEEVQSTLSNGELFMMNFQAAFIVKKVEKAKMPTKIEGKSAQLLMEWIRRKLFWKVQGRDALFFSELPPGIL